MARRELLQVFLGLIGVVDLEAPFFSSMARAHGRRIVSPARAAFLRRSRSVLIARGPSRAFAARLGRSSEWKVTLVNQGFDFAFNVTAEIVNAPRFLQITDPLARFVHPDDTNAELLTTVMPLSTAISDDIVSIARKGKSHGDDDDGDDDEDDNGEDHRGRAARRDPCDVLTWRIHYETSTGEVVSKDVPPSIPGLCPCSGPTAGTTWENHGAYVSCVARAAARFRRAGLLTKSQAHAVVRAAARSSCGGHGRSEDDDHRRDDDDQRDDHHREARASRRR